MTGFALAGRSSGELLTYQGRVIVHGDRAEMEFLFPRERVVQVPSWVQPAETMRLQDHPDMAPVTFPLDRREFR